MAGQRMAHGARDERNLKDWWMRRGENLTGLMPRHDEETVHQFVAALEAVFQRHGVEQTPMVLLRVEDVLVSWLVVRRIEDLLWAEGVYEESTEDAPKPKSRAGAFASVSQGLILLPAIETAGKARERMRKAVKELEEACEKMGTPIDRGIHDIMKPIIEGAEGVLEDAIAFEEKKKEE